jgi:hypothetical protein
MSTDLRTVSSNVAELYEPSPRFKEVDFDTVWEEFGNLSEQYKTINLGSGFPNYESLTYLREVTKEVLDESNFYMHQYTRPHVKISIS